ncbi:hypothetical protein [Bosea sp. ASV33]|uniref:hypothetical protein n=1 Tax=Bosea sp. ASV33 TaxID=2795106 RepID=UPI0018EBD4E8|nr:hypothetical protein [Bosea sp. ASV33]
MYDPKDWYWLADDGRLFSSAAGDVITDDLPAYLDWREAGHLPSLWPSDGVGAQTDAALQSVLAPYGVYLDLIALKVALKACIDADAEAERLKYITPGAGQAMTYQAKADEARRLQNDATPKAANYPLLSAEVGVTAPTLTGVGAVVLEAYQQWQTVGGAIETARLTAKKQVDDAETAEAVRAVRPIWP